MGTIPSLTHASVIMDVCVLDNDVIIGCDRSLAGSSSTTTNPPTPKAFRGVFMFTEIIFSYADHAVASRRCYKSR
jgi:hypothetical protein